MHEFGQLVLGKIIEIVATNWQILRLKCTKFDFSWGSVPLGERRALPRLLAGSMGLLLREGMERKGGKREWRVGWNGKRRERKEGIGKERFRRTKIYDYIHGKERTNE